MRVMPLRPGAQNDMFGQLSEAEPEPLAGARPLADRLRPRSLNEVVGQGHLLGPDGTLNRMLERGSLASLILWGPPGCGKTTIARLLAARSDLHFVQLSAVFSGVADLKRAFDEAARRRRTGQGTLLFVDEIHRFNRAQQDGFLPVVETGTVTLIGATTENPSFALNGALLRVARYSCCGVWTTLRWNSCWREPRQRWAGNCRSMPTRVPACARWPMAMAAMS